MQERIVINGKGYPTKEITFNTVCQFEDMGVPMSDIEAKSIMFIRAYAAMCMGVKADQAGEEIEKHILNGGTMEELADVLRQAVEESGFFQALSKRAETADSKVQTETA